MITFKIYSPLGASSLEKNIPKEKNERELGFLESYEEKDTSPETII